MRGKPLKPEQRELALAMLLAGMSYRYISNTLTISLGAVHRISRQIKENEQDEQCSFSKTKGIQV